MIYFIQEAGTNHIKIGFADKSVTERLNSLQTGNPHKLTLLLVLERGTPAVEKYLHQRFAIDLASGEWFRPSPELLEFLADPPVIVDDTPAEDSPLLPGMRVRLLTDSSGISKGNGTVVCIPEQHGRLAIQMDRDKPGSLVECCRHELKVLSK